MSLFNVYTAFGAVAVAAALSAAFIRAIHPLLIRYAMARPNARSSHKVPTPQGAGIAVIAATLLVAGSTIAITGAATTAVVWTLACSTVVIAIVGAMDDLQPMPVAPRLLLQALCVASVLYVTPSTFQLLTVIPLWVERLILLLAALWFVNLVNFMDGLDWMTVAEVVPVTAALVLIGLSGEVPLSTAIIAAALCGSMLGFAPFNRPVARIFLGDVGSLPIGLVLSWCLLQLAYAHHFAAAVLLPLYYIVDASLTLLRRAMQREPIWLAHRSHFYQQATDNGFTVVAVVRNVFALNVALAAMAGLSVFLQSMLADAIMLVAGTAIVAFVLHAFATPRHSR